MLFYLLSVLGLVPTFQKTKCKRLLNITMERIKVLENRRQARVRQLHRDVIELLQLKKEQKVQPLVMRIWKEQCLFSVYIKIAEYCGLVQINLKDIAEQRECPYDLKEPVAGLCFAASCCADLPELQELREIFAMKYGKELVKSGQDLQPNHHVHQKFLDFLYAKDPSDIGKQALLDEIIMKYSTMNSHEQQKIHFSLSTESLVDACNRSQEQVDYTIKESDIKDQSESEELKEADVVQESNHIEPVCKADLVSTGLANEVVNRKRTLEDRETSHSASKKAYRRRRFWMSKAMDGEENGGEEHEQTTVKVHYSIDKLGQGAQAHSNTGRRLVSVHPDEYKGCEALPGEGVTTHMNEGVVPNEDLPMSIYVERPLYSQPPQRPPPPPPPPKRAPPPTPSLRVVSMPGSCNDKQVNANTTLPLHCSTMANNYYLETYGSHVHPRLPKYEDLVANFTALKR